ncbi:hypothetical protein WICPIJ_000993 [Wickerhamomyces pijperi]|uniref:Serine/threonine-protein kinase RIO1 n=1 Tax=Wickerhamomyces pijperi TaxID=599730 RepID=A0A9P8QF01_WICPI|nr:hypothetical protein WICPIJ_000993 [Wickerhamomyces pijperi]
MSEFEEVPIEQQVEHLHFSSDSETDSDSDISDYEDDSNTTTTTTTTTTTNSTANGTSATAVPAGEKKQLNKAQILTKYAENIKTDEYLIKAKKTYKDKADRATVENVLDPRTINFIVKLIKKGTITKINGCLSTGKEANVYHAEAPDGKEYAVKIYKTSILVFKDRERYVDGEFRFRNARSQHNPRKMIKIWAEKEFRNLKRLHTSGLAAPEPIDLKSHVLVMEFLTGGDGFPSPKLRDYPFEDLEDVTRFYHQMIYNIRYMFQVCRLVHADLSEYNTIVHKGQLYTFDVSQSVEPEHPMSLDFLRMDIKNINDFFMKKGIDVVSEKAIFTFVIEDKETLKISDGSEDEGKSWFELIEKLPLKSQEKEGEDEVFRSVHLLRSLNHLEDRDFEKFRDGKIDTLKALVSKEDQVAGSQASEAGANEEADDGEDDSEEDEDDDSEDSESDEEREERSKELKGKKHEDKDEKKLRKQKAKEEAKEKRKTKMKKHIKKKLVNKGKK